jgi:hypothetical protein
MYLYELGKQEKVKYNNRRQIHALHDRSIDPSGASQPAISLSNKTLSITVQQHFNKSIYCLNQKYSKYCDRQVT